MARESAACARIPTSRGAASRGASSRRSSARRSQRGQTPFLHVMRDNLHARASVRAHGISLPSGSRGARGVASLIAAAPMPTDAVTSRPPPADRRRPLWVLAAAGMQLAFLVWAARAAIPPALSCDVCDTSYYYTAAAEIAKSGLLFFNPYDGYRSYFVPLFIAVVQRLARWLGFDGGAVERYTYGVSILFWLRLRRPHGVARASRRARRTFWTTSGRHAAQSLSARLRAVRAAGRRADGRAACRCCSSGPARKTGTPARRAALVMSMALLAYIIRASLVWWLPPAAMYAAWLLWPQIRHPRRWLPWMAAVVVAGASSSARRSTFRSSKSGSFNPYPSTTPLAQQIAWGITLLKFATVEDEGHWRGLTYWSPFVAEPEEDKTAGFYLEHPMRGAFLMLTHAYAGFHYDQIKPYWRLDRARPLTIWLVLSSAIVFLGVVRMTAIVLAGELDADRAFAIATLSSCAWLRSCSWRRSRGSASSDSRCCRSQVAEWIGSRPSRARVVAARPGPCSCTWRCRSSTTRCCCKVRISGSRSILFAHSLLVPAMLAADSRHAAARPVALAVERTRDRFDVHGQRRAARLAGARARLRRHGPHRLCRRAPGTAVRGP